MRVIASFAPGPEGEAALVEAARQRDLFGGELLVVGTIPTDDARAATRQAAQAHGAGSVVEVSEGEDAVETILDLVGDAGDALLVIGLRRRTPVGKLILGSSAQRLLLDAPCPVLSVKPDGGTPGPA